MVSEFRTDKRSVGRCAGRRGARSENAILDPDLINMRSRTILTGVEFSLTGTKIFGQGTEYALE